MQNSVTGCEKQYFINHSQEIILLQQQPQINPCTQTYPQTVYIKKIKKNIAHYPIKYITIIAHLKSLIAAETHNQPRFEAVTNLSYIKYKCMLKTLFLLVY